ncbi:hypothetical protein YC2023_055489 [Brassica napus]
MLDLPEDLVEDEILSRVPMTSLRSVRSTCKKWNNLCKNRIFLGKKASAKKQFLIMGLRRICLMNFDLRKDNGDPSMKQVSVLDQIPISKVFQCDGFQEKYMPNLTHPFGCWAAHLTSLGSWYGILT